MSKGDGPDETKSSTQIEKDHLTADTPEDSNSANLQTEEETVDENKAVVSPEPYIKHPLQHKWALWFFKNERGKDWADCLKIVSEFDTVEDFWALYNHIQPSSKLPQGCDYSLFKDGIRPMWEDDANKKGGKWLLQIQKQQRSTELDKIWLETLLCLIGEGFGEDSDYVNGAVVQIRPKFARTNIWTSDYRNSESILRIGNIYKQRLSLSKNFQIGFQTHSDSMKKSSSTVKNIYTI